MARALQRLLSLSSSGTASLALPSAFPSIGRALGTRVPLDDVLPRKREILAKFGQGEVTLELGERLATVTLSQPDKRNALSGKMMSDLWHVINELEEWQGSTVVLTGEGNQFFCSGMDFELARELSSDKESGRLMCLYMQTLLTRFRRLPQVTIAAIEGGATGGGAEITTCTDYRVMSSNAFVQFVQVKMGLSPGWGGGSRLVHLVGRQHALKMLATGQRKTALELSDIGFADVVCNELTAKESALVFAEPFLKPQPGLVRAAKSVVAFASDNTHDDSLNGERSVFQTLWGEEAFLEALGKASAK